jgi:hypothetical protein
MAGDKRFHPVIYDIDYTFLELVILLPPFVLAVSLLWNNGLRHNFYEWAARQFGEPYLYGFKAEFYLSDGNETKCFIVLLKLFLSKFQWLALLLVVNIFFIRLCYSKTTCGCYINNFVYVFILVPYVTYSKQHIRLYSLFIVPLLFQRH